MQPCDSISYVARATFLRFPNKNRHFSRSKEIDNAPPEQAKKPLFDPEKATFQTPKSQFQKLCFCANFTGRRIN